MEQLITWLDVMIGPLGWLGWFIAAGVSLALWHLWRSSGPKELRKLNRAMKEARVTIDEFRTENLALKNRNDELSTSLHISEQLNKELAAKIERQDAAIDLLNNSIERCGKENLRLSAEVSKLTGRVYQLMAHAGMNIDPTKPASEGPDGKDQ